MIRVRLKEAGFYIYVEKAMVTHSSTFAWRIPWTEEPGSKAVENRNPARGQKLWVGGCGRRIYACLLGFQGIHCPWQVRPVSEMVW